MNRSQLVDALTDKLGDKKTATSAVDALLATVQTTVAQGEKVSLFGFGVFEKVDRPARTARNPANGERIQLDESSVPRFRPGAAFKAAVNTGHSAAPSASPAKKAAAAGAPTTSVSEPVSVKKPATSKTDKKKDQDKKDNKVKDKKDSKKKDKKR